MKRSKRPLWRRVGFVLLHPGRAYRLVRRRLIRKAALWNLKLRLRGLEVGSEEWKILQEKVSRVGGELGEALRALFYARSLCKCGANPRFFPGVIMAMPHNIELGDEVTLNRGVYIAAQTKVTIGNHVLIGPYVHINSGNHRFDDPAVPIRQQGKALKPIVIEDDVWIAANVVVTAGSHIGRGSVVMAGAVVSGTIEPYSVVGGIPARVVRRRGQRAVVAMQRQSTH